MTSDQYQSWKDHPLTQLFHQYLTDYRHDLMERWAQGSIRAPEDLMAVARCQMAQELTSLDDNTISDFYRQQTKGSDDVREDKDPG
jgi:hypothetical protein